MLNHWSIIYTIDRNGSPIDVGFVLAYMKNASIISCGIKPYLSSSCEFFVLAIAIVYHIFNNQQEAVLCSLISYVNASYINRFYIQSTLFFLFFFLSKNEQPGDGSFFVLFILHRFAAYGATKRSVVHLTKSLQVSGQLVFAKSQGGGREGYQAI